MAVHISAAAEASDDDAVTDPGARRALLRTCPLCEAVCGLELTLDAGDHVVGVRGDREDPFSRGFLCPKGASLGQLDTDPDRLTTPMIRDRADDSWRAASWQEAFDLVAERIPALVQEYGRSAAALYLGNPNAHTVAGELYAPVLLRALSTRDLYSAGTADQMPEQVASGLMFGDPLTVPVPDLDRTDHLLILGANPLESNGSLCTAPNYRGRLEALRTRGGRWWWSIRDAPGRRNRPTSTSSSVPAAMPICCSGSCTRCSPNSSPTSA
jgi:anaerobic selenocysteine-containing dehydrogenase